MIETSPDDTKIKLEVMAHFDKDALEFDFERTAAGYRLRHRLIESLIKKEAKPHASALDLGCGTGEYTLSLANEGFMVVGGDLSKGMLAVAKSKVKRHRLAHKIQLMRLESTKLPLRSKCLDSVTCIAVFDWVPNFHRLLTETGRVLKHQGKLILCVDALWSPYRIYKNIKFAIVHHRKRIVRILTIMELNRTLRTCGFIVERFFGDVLLAQVIAHLLYEPKAKVLANNVLKLTQPLDRYLTNLLILKTFSEHYIIEARKK